MRANGGSWGLEETWKDRDWLTVNGGLDMCSSARQQSAQVNSSSAATQAGGMGHGRYLEREGLADSEWGVPPTHPAAGRQPYAVPEHTSSLQTQGRKEKQ